MQEMKKPIEVFDAYSQGLINMHVDLCLIRLVREYGSWLKEFDENARDTAIDRSLDFMDGYVSDFEGYLDYLQSPDYIQQRYEKITRPDQADGLGLVDSPESA